MLISVDDLVVEGGTLVVRAGGRVMRFPRRRIRRGYVVDGRLTLWVRGGVRIDADLEAGRAEQLRATLGLAGGPLSLARHDSLRSAVWAVSSAFGAVALGFALSHIPSFALGAATLAGAVGAYFGPRTAPRVLVGVDGIRVGRKTYPFGKLRRDREREWVVILPDGDTVTLDPLDARHLLRAPSPAEASPVDRDGRTVEEWREALRGSRQEGYRREHITDAELEAALASPSLEQRIGGALALADPANPDVRRRIRALARRHVDPDARRALEQIAAGEPDAKTIESALRNSTMLAP